MVRLRINSCWLYLGNMGREIRLRPHHILCLHGFKGKGYSNAFIDNMYGVLKDLKANPRLKISLRIGLDLICSSCTEENLKICKKTSSKVERMDRIILRRLRGLKRKTTLTDLLPLYYNNIKPKDMRRICLLCQWFENRFLYIWIQG